MGKSSSSTEQTTSHGDSMATSEPVHILSKKQQRAAKKAAKKLEALQKDPAALKAWKQQQAKEERKREDRAHFHEILKQERDEHKLKQKKKRNRLLNSKNPSAASSDGKKKASQASTSNQRPSKKAKTTDGDIEEVDVSHKVLAQMKQGTTDGEWTVLERGVKYKDVVKGKGLREVPEGALVSVKYAVRGAQSAAIIDSSGNFKFRVGEGEVIQGFDMAVMGMREGGRRHVLVPPKAGYGSQDIGAGPGALLHFDITLLNIQQQVRR